MSFPPPSPDDFKIEDMLDIEEIIPTESTYRVTGLTPEENVVILEKRWEGIMGRGIWEKHAFLI